MSEQIEYYNKLLGIVNNLKDVVYSDKTHYVIIHSIGQECHINSNIENDDEKPSKPSLEFMASKTLEQLKITSNEISSLVNQIIHLLSVEFDHAPDVQTVRNEIFIHAERGINSLISLLSTIHEFDYLTIKKADVSEETIDQLRTVFQKFKEINDYLRGYIV